jgi:hypothetical protein
LKPGTARPGGSTRDPADPGPEPGRVDEKTGEGKTWRVDPADPVTNLLTFVFFVFFLLKRRRFDFFFKELTRPTRSNPVTRPKPGTRALDRAGS